MAVTLTPNAATHVQRSLSKRGKGVGLRVGVRTSGCSGLAYKLEFADQLNPGDVEFESHGVKVVVDPKSALYVTGSELDYVDALTDGGFKVKNPNAATSCSCGESFSA